jgi:hypothetical protein
VQRAGIYNVYTGDDQQDAEFVALNYDRKESKLEYFSASELKEMYPQENIKIINTAGASITGLVEEINEGIVLWRVCIILALIFLGAEVLLLRFLK